MHRVTGEVLVSNLAEPLRFATPISNPEYWAAQSFVADGRYSRLDSIDAYVGDAMGDPTVVAELRYHDSSGAIDLTPAGLVATFTAPDVSGPAAPQTFVPDLPVTLLPNGGYWFVLGGTASDSFNWGYAETGLWEGAGTLDWFADSSDAGTTWTYYGDPAPFQPYLIQVNVEFLSGDFDGNGAYECADIDALTADIASGSQTPLYDLTGDGFVDTADLDAWLAEAGSFNLASGNPYLPGDANLDGVVDGSDFIIWNANKFTSSAAWCSGDFNADGVVDGSDFIKWNANKFTSADATVKAVAEPAWPGAALILLAIAGCRRVRLVSLNA